MRLRLFLLLACMLVSPATAQTNPAFGAPVNPSIVQSPWPTYHGGPARQASTSLPGPVSRTQQVEVRYFERDAGAPFGTSPWHIISDRRYSNSPTARSLWGVSLQYVYKYEIDGDVFRYVDSFKLHDLPLFIGWNFFAFSDGRFVVPTPNGLRTPDARGGPCAGNAPALLTFRDGPNSNSPIACVAKFEFTAERVQQACGFRRTIFGTTGVFSDPLFRAKSPSSCGAQERAKRTSRSLIMRSPAS